MACNLKAVVAVLLGVAFILLVTMSGDAEAVYRYRAGYYYSRYGSRLYSSYVRSYQPARYSRLYRSYRTYYYRYYTRYFNYMRSPSYYSRPTMSDDVNVCMNYEANENGTYMGAFTCPLEFEPANFTMCCGEQYAEFCCVPTEAKAGTITGIGSRLGILGSSIGVLLIRLLLH